MGSSGGGGEGTPDKPDEFKWTHSEWLDSHNKDRVFYSVADALNDALGFDGNPWTDATAQDPSSYLANMGTLYSDLDADIYDGSTGVDPYFSTFVGLLTQLTLSH